MIIDSHCHLNNIDLTDFGGSMDNVIAEAMAQGVSHFLSVCVELKDFPSLCVLANNYRNVSISVGVHPDNTVPDEPDAKMLSGLAESHPSCIAIGETGLDYYRTETKEAKALQKQRFREHIRAAITSSKPLIIHTREASADTLAIMKEEKAERIGGVMHCFTEDLDVATKAMDMNFYISLSGIVTFKNALVVQHVAKNIPLDRLLIETDAPYLAPVPYRGKQNHPALVKEVLLKISELRGLSFEEVALQTSKNFQQCFNICF